MKKILTALLLLMLVLATGCGGGNTPAKNDGDKPAEDQKIKLGMITRLNVSEMLLDNYFEQAASRMQQTADLYAPKHVFFDNMNSMIAALDSGQVDRISTYSSVAKYLLAHNDKLEQTKDRVPKISDSFCCAMLKDNAALLKEFDTAIDKLKASGKLAEITKTYITDLDGKEPSAVDMPHFDGAQTIKIAVTGDLPPLDLITADGKPAGFNTALLAAISQIIGKNFELVQVDSGARAAALTSKQVDVVFWVTVPRDDTIVPADYDKPEGVILTAPYFSDEIAHVKVKG